MCIVGYVIMWNGLIPQTHGCWIVVAHAVSEHYHLQPGALHCSISSTCHYQSILPHTSSQTFVIFWSLENSDVSQIWYYIYTQYNFGTVNTCDASIHWKVAKNILYCVNNHILLICRWCDQGKENTTGKFKSWSIHVRLCLCVLNENLAMWIVMSSLSCHFRLVWTEICKL